MAKQELNTVYISERLAESLRPIARAALTTVVAPMGYGKTTAVNWYLTARAGSARILRISVYSDNLAIFWRSVQTAFAHTGFDLLADYPCPTDASGGSLLCDDLCHALDDGTETYIFIDDFHLLTDSRVIGFLCTCACRLPENVHLIVAGRDRFLPEAQALRLGNRVCRIGVEELRLNHTELAAYARRCRTPLTDAQIKMLLYTTEGWFSAVYLNLRTLAARGTLPDLHADIYEMFTDAMIAPLPPALRTFLAVMGLADEFTTEMARAVTAREDAAALLDTLTAQNAFVTRTGDGVTYRFHHMMKECAARGFQTLPAADRRAYLDRYGAWYAAHGQYLHAMNAFRASGNADAWLGAVERDAGILLSSLPKEEVQRALSACPDEALDAHPLALLVLMRCMFNRRCIPEMMQLHARFLAAVRAHPEMPDAERDNLLGKCDLILSFLYYNDIAAMSRLHRSAGSRMTRRAVSIQTDGGWTFGSPSVLMMFHRTPGALEDELLEMDACMPYYYKVTGGHGQGAELLMRAEADFLRGRFADAQIGLERAYARAEAGGQINMALCCDFLACRLRRVTGIAADRADARRASLPPHRPAWLHLADAIDAYDAALDGETAHIPAVFAAHTLDTVHTLAPDKPMIDMIENQVWLSQGEAAKVAARSAELLTVCDAMHYSLVALHLHLQAAAAYEQLGKHAEARAALGAAFDAAIPDGFLLPFVESYGCLRGLLALPPADTAAAAFVRRICEMGEEILARRSAARAGDPTSAALTVREREIAVLAADRRSNREIAEALYLSEGSVKQYLNRIYAKLHIEGDTRTKRQQLAQLFCKT